MELLVQKIRFGGFLRRGAGDGHELEAPIRPRIRGLQLSAPFGQVELVAPLLPKPVAPW